VEFSDNVISYLPQDKTAKIGVVSEEGIDFDEEDGVNLDIPDGVNQEEAQIELFKSILGKFLRVLNHKLKPRTRTLEEDRQAVNRPTKWKDLGRNILQKFAGRMDPNNKESGAKEEEEAKIEKIKAIKLFFKKVLKAIKKALKNIKPKVKSRLLRPSQNDRQEMWRRGYRPAESVEIELNGQDEAAEIEDMRLVLTNALDHIDQQHTPKFKLQEDEEGVTEEMPQTNEIAQQESLWKLAKQLLRRLRGKKRRG